MICVSLINFHKDIFPIGWYKMIQSCNEESIKYLVDQKWSEVLSELNDIDIEVIPYELEHELRKRFITEDELAVQFATCRIDILEAFYEEWILKHSKSNDINMVYSFCSNKSLEVFCRNNNIPMKYIELSPIREGEFYNYTLAWYLDSPVMRSKNEGIIRYRNFKKDIPLLNIDKPFPALSLMLLYLYQSEMVQFIAKYHSEEKFDIGVGLPGPRAEINNGWMPDIILKAISDNTQFVGKRKLIREHPGHNEIPVSIKDKSRNSMEFVNKCQTIISSGSNITFEAMMLNKNIVDFSDIFYSDVIANDLDKLEDGHRYDDWYINFMFFSVFVPFERLFNNEYIAWRKSEPNEFEIFNDNLSYILNEMLDYEIEIEDIYNWEKVYEKRVENSLYDNHIRENVIRVLDSFSAIDWKHEKVIICGTGKDAVIIKNIIEKIGGRIDSYLVMDKNPMRELAGVVVNRWNDKLYEKDCVFIVSQRSMIVQKDVCQALRKEGYERIMVL